MPMTLTIATDHFRGRSENGQNETCFVFAAYDPEQITTPSVFSHATLVEAEENRWRKTKRTTSTAAVRWDA
jgi:hypothetical protein